MDSSDESLNESLSSTGSIKPYRYEPRPGDVNEECETTGTSSESEYDDSDDNDDDDDEWEDVKSWCWCTNCENMSAREEARCCANVSPTAAKMDEPRLKCITEHDGFIVNCLNHYVIETEYYDYMIKHGDMKEGQMIHELYQHLAISRFIRWTYGLVGRRHKKKIPSCVVMKIRNAYTAEGCTCFEYPENPQLYWKV